MFQLPPITGRLYDLGSSEFDKVKEHEKYETEKTTKVASQVGCGSQVTEEISGTPVRDHCQQEPFVHIPDLFSSIMAVEPVVNLHYDEVKPEADAWIARLIKADDKWTSKNVRVDFAYMAAIWAPYCDAEALRVMVDWNHWIFLFDDQFDEGHLSADPITAKEEIAKTLIIMDDTQPPVLPDEPLRYAFQTIWDRVKKRASPELQRRWKDMHKLYFNGVLKQVDDMYNKRAFARDVEEYMCMRRGTIGSYPTFVLIEYAHGINVPGQCFNHPSLQECMRVSSDLTILVNDILSYRKDLALGVDHNLISLLKYKGHSTQDAVDEIGNMIKECYKQWYIGLANMPAWGESIDREILNFIDACRNLPLGNLYWSFKTGRYLGPEGDLVHKTRILKLPKSA